MYIVVLVKERELENIQPQVLDEQDVNRDGSNDKITIENDTNGFTVYSIDLENTGTNDFVIKLNINDDTVERKVLVDDIEYTDKFTESDNKYHLELKNNTTVLFEGEGNLLFVDKIVNILKSNFTVVFNTYSSLESVQSYNGELKIMN